MVRKENVFGNTDYDIQTGFPVEVSTINSNGSKILNKYTYPYHINSTVSQKMLDNNELSVLMEENYKIIKNGNALAEKRIVYDYIMQPSGLLPYRLNSLKTNDDVTNALYEVEKYNLYDPQGNITEYVRKDGVTVTLLWGYNYQKLVAEVIGASYSNVIGNIGITYSQLQFLPESSIQTVLQSFRTKNIGLITSYTYYTSRGLHTKTDPRGVTTYYDYDGFGRLKRTYIIENGAKKTIETYDYHYKP